MISLSAVIPQGRAHSRKLNSMIPPRKKNPKPVEVKIEESIKSIIEKLNETKSSEDIDAVLNLIEEDIESITGWPQYKDSMTDILRGAIQAKIEPILHGNFYGLFNLLRKTITMDWVLSNLEIKPLFEKAIEWIEDDELIQFINMEYVAIQIENPPYAQKGDGEMDG